jgi:hypothetical protein
MIAAGDVQRLHARTTWPMHRSVRALYEEAGRSGKLAALPSPPVFMPSPEVGLAAKGLDAAFRDLIRSGFLREVGRGLDAALVVHSESVVALRRSLMLRDPSVVAMLQRAGSRWAASTSTSWKYAATADRSSASTVASVTA